MDQPTDPLARQLALSALTTEQFNLQTARMGTIAPARGVQLSTAGPELDRGHGLCRGTFRIRQFFLGLDPAAVPFFPPTDPWGMTKLERIGVVATGPLQMLLTAASMVACINAIVGGVAVALALRSLLEASAIQIEGEQPARCRRSRKEEHEQPRGIHRPDAG
jgi:hypothetical protein